MGIRVVEILPCDSWHFWYPLIFNGTALRASNWSSKNYMQTFVFKIPPNVSYLCIRGFPNRILTFYVYFKSKNKMYSDFAADFSRSKWLNIGHINLVRKSYRNVLISLWNCTHTSHNQNFHHQITVHFIFRLKMRTEGCYSVWELSDT